MHRKQSPLMIAGFLAALFVGTAPTMAQTRYDRVVLEENTVIPVVLDREISSQTARRGDRVQARVRVEGDEYLGIPEGSRVEGRVQEVQRHRGDQPGVLDIEFNRLRTPDGQTYPLNASLVSLNNDSVERREDGRIVARANRGKDRTKFIGYGAGAAAILGALTRGGKLRLTDILLGAAAGYAYGESVKDKGRPSDVNLRAGTEFGLALERQIVLRDEEDRLSSRYGSASPSSRTDRYDRYDRTTRTRTSDRYSDSNRYSDSDRDVRVDFSGSARPYQLGGVWMLPVRTVLDAAGVDYRFDTGRKELHVSNTMNGLRVGTDSRAVRFDDGSRNTLPQPVVLRNGTLYAPVRFFEMATMRRVSYEDPSRTVYLLAKR